MPSFPTGSGAAVGLSAKAVAGGGRGARPADLLSLAAAPTFIAMAIMAMSAGSSEMICSTGGTAFSLTGMPMMYLLMCAFHLAPWLRLLSHGAQPRDGRAA